ncbi:hypothetical protein J2W25_001938 [Variovorax boronicumulans]|uniref:Uncharacterized protein n=1 Tax=Variovorax boronicumulans TaxID=436515 RepID=A0AAW8DUC8_9BURK|nr:hypothetical protein [Variovorax boronicumulans]MDP9877632.1 hypothetical protein [Variovorax boronicumulans]MDP9922917.1 hypothetical protein [Variovorax boronicumulans]
MYALGYCSGERISKCPSRNQASCFIKLQLPEGEIDVVVGVPLTAPNFEVVEYERRPIRVETSAEIIAKKMWHRGDQAKARDRFDLHVRAGRNRCRAALHATTRSRLPSEIGCPRGKGRA